MSKFASLTSYFDLAELIRKSMFSITHRNKPMGHIMDIS